MRLIRKQCCCVPEMDYVCVKCSEEAEAKDMDVEAIPAISEEELIEAGLDLFDAEIIE